MVKLEDFGFKEVEKAWLEKDKPRETDYPKPIERLRLMYESYNLSIEETYFWLLNHMRIDWNFPSEEIEKITDVFSSSEMSSYWGMNQQRLALQQDRASQYLKGISEMVKAMFQIVREIRIIKERLDYYESSYQNDKNAESSEIALKGIWIDMVEGGMKNPASVYGLAREVGFTILPDLFFRIRIKKEEEDKIDEIVAEKAREFNAKVREVLARKLIQYTEWKKRTYEELKTRKNFTLKYLRQHYDTIQLYINWIKPYLRAIKRMGSKEKHMMSPDIISAFETAMIELEFLAKKPQGKKYYSCILASFNYKTAPKMEFQQEAYQHKGPIHVGKVEFTLRAYAWTKEDIENYKKYRQAEDMELLSSVDESVKAALDALGDELKNYLKEAGEVIKEGKIEPVKKKAEKLQFSNPFTALIGGFGEMISALTGIGKREYCPSCGNEIKKSDTKCPVCNEPLKKPTKEEEFELEKEKKKAEDYTLFCMFQIYKNYKKSHGLLSW